MEHLFGRGMMVAERVNPYDTLASVYRLRLQCREAGVTDAVEDCERAIAWRLVSGVTPCAVCAGTGCSGCGWTGEDRS